MTDRPWFSGPAMHNGVSIDPKHRQTEMLRWRKQQQQDPIEKKQRAESVIFNIENVQNKPKTAAVSVEAASRRDRAINKTTKAIKGVAATSWGRWNARTYFAGKTIHIGCFDTQEKAALACEIARKTLKSDDRPKGTAAAINAAMKAVFEGVNKRNAREIRISSQRQHRNKSNNKSRDFHRNESTKQQCTSLKTKQNANKNVLHQRPVVEQALDPPTKRHNHGSRGLETKKKDNATGWQIGGDISSSNIISNSRQMRTLRRGGDLIPEKGSQGKTNNTETGGGSSIQVSKTSCHTSVSLPRTVTDDSESNASTCSNTTSQNEQNDEGCSSDNSMPMQEKRRMIHHLESSPATEVLAATVSPTPAATKKDRRSKTLELDSPLEVQTGRSLEKMRSKHAAELASRNETIHVLRSKTKELRKKLNECSASEAATDKKFEELEEKLDYRLSTIEELISESKGLQDELEVSESTNEQLLSEAKALKEQLEHSNNKNRRLEQELTEKKGLQEELELSKRTNEQLLLKEKALKEQLEVSNNNLRHVSSDKNSLQKLIVDSKNTIEQLLSEKEGLQEQLAMLEVKNRDSLSNITALQQQFTRSVDTGAQLLFEKRFLQERIVNFETNTPLLEGKISQLQEELLISKNKNEKIMLTNQQWQAKDAEQEKRLKMAEIESRQLQNELNTSQVKRVDLQVVLESNAKELQELRNDKTEYLQEMDKKNCQLQKELSSRGKQLINSQVELENNKQELQALRNDKEEYLRDTDKQKCQLQNELSSSQKQLIDVKAELENNKQELQALMNDKEEYLRETDKQKCQLQNELSSSQKKIIDLEAMLENTDKEIRGLRNDKKNLQTVVKNNVQDLRGSRNDNENFKTALESNAKELRELRNDKKNLQALLENGARDIQNVLNDKKKYEQENGILKDLLVEKQREHNQILEAQLEENNKKHEKILNDKLSEAQKKHDRNLEVEHSDAQTKNSQTIEARIQELQRTHEETLKARLEDTRSECNQIMKAQIDRAREEHEQILKVRLEDAQIKHDQVLKAQLENARGTQKQLLGGQLEEVQSENYRLKNVDMKNLRDANQKLQAKVQESREEVHNAKLKCEHFYELEIKYREGSLRVKSKNEKLQKKLEESEARSRNIASEKESLEIELASCKSKLESYNTQLGVCQSRRRQIEYENEQLLIELETRKSLELFMQDSSEYQDRIENKMEFFARKIGGHIGDVYDSNDSDDVEEDDGESVDDEDDEIEGEVCRPKNAIQTATNYDVRSNSLGSDKSDREGNSNSLEEVITTEMILADNEQVGIENSNGIEDEKMKAKCIGQDRTNEFNTTGGDEGHFTIYSKKLTKQNAIATTHTLPPAPTLQGQGQAAPERQQIPVTLSVGELKVGSKIGVYWEDDKCYYPCTIVRQVDATGLLQSKFFVRYDDGEQETLDMASEKFCRWSSEYGKKLNVEYQEFQIVFNSKMLGLGLMKEGTRVVVSSIARKTVCNHKVQPGDILTSVGDESVLDPRQVVKLVSESRRPIIVGFERAVAAPTSSQSNGPITSPNVNDVLCGRGVLPNSAYLKAVRDHQDDYMPAKLEERRAIIQKVIDFVHNDLGGRFLVRDKNQKWVVRANKDVVDKVRKALCDQRYQK